MLDMRARNPWVFFLRRLFGWNVRFIVQPLLLGVWPRPVVPGLEAPAVVFRSPPSPRAGESSARRVRGARVARNASLCGRCAPVFGVDPEAA